MTRIETARVKEVLDMSITSVKEAANNLRSDCELQELEADIAALEKSVADLRGALAGLPFRHSQ